MKIIGVVCFIIGILSFFGAALQGDSVFGPLFWLALGAFLIHKANNDKSAKEKQIYRPIHQQASNFSEIHEITPNKVSQSHKDALENIHSQLTVAQREAAMCLISFFGGFNDNLSDDTPMLVFHHAGLFFGMPSSPTEVMQMMSKFSDADSLIDTIITIKSSKAREYLLLSCYDMIKTTHNSEAYELFFNIAKDLGYDKMNIEDLIKQYRS